MENKGGKRLARKDTDRRREELPEGVRTVTFQIEEGEAK